jgi:hypothetical protein
MKKLVLFDEYILEVRTDSAGVFEGDQFANCIEEYWPNDCVALAFVWNTLAQKPGMEEGETFFNLPGYAGIVYIDLQGNWNVVQNHRLQLPWSGSIPINAIVEIIKKVISLSKELV